MADANFDWEAYVRDLNKEIEEYELKIHPEKKYERKPLPDPKWETALAKNKREYPLLVKELENMLRELDEHKIPFPSVGYFSLARNCDYVNTSYCEEMRWEQPSEVCDLMMLDVEVPDNREGLQYKLSVRYKSESLKVTIYDDLNDLIGNFLREADKLNPT
jgi:hypothetical protein